jgi:outer membrane protein insertion porin family
MIKYILKILFVSLFLIGSSFSEIIKKIEITGNKRISRETIIVLGKINLNVDYSDNELNILTKRLYETEFFKDISVLLKEKTLLIDVIENPIVEDIQITGIKQDKLTETLLEKMSLKNRKSFTENYLQNDINLIKNVLKSMGYYFVKIKPSITTEETLNTARIIIDIDQGPKAKIKQISFIGDKKIKDKKLLDVIASEEHRFWKFISRNVYLDQSRLNLDKRLIENYYKNLGYYNVNVLNTYAELDKKGNFNLTYNISAGNFYYFNDFKLNLPENYNKEDFEKIINRFPKLQGKKFSIDDFNQILFDIENVATSRLYDFINAEVVEEVVDDDKLNFSFNVSDSTKHYVERINILGNYTTIEEVIRNKLIVDEGDPLNRILYNKSIDNIRALGIFKNVKAKIKDGSNQNLKEINISVEEKPTGEISLAAGVGTSGSTLGGGIVERNFLGKGINLSTNLEISEESVKGAFVYSKPNFAYSDNTLFTSLRSTSTDNLGDFGYKVSETGVSVGSEFEQYENLYFRPTARASIEDLETNSSASAALKKQEGNYTDIYFDYGLNYDLRNSKYRPTSGNVTSFYQELPLISNSNEISNTFTFTQFKKLSKISDMTGRASIYLKAIKTVSSDNDVRISKRGFVPQSRLRGFEKGKIGPIEDNTFIGGNYVSTLNLSTNLPFLMPSFENVDFSYFIDAANVWGVDYDSSIDDSSFIRSATGIGMNLLTPIGPLSFSLSQPITKKSSDRTETFRFNLGTTF